MTGVARRKAKRTASVWRRPGEQPAGHGHPGPGDARQQRRRLEDPDQAGARVAEVFDGAEASLAAFTVSAGRARRSSRRRSTSAPARMAPLTIRNMAAVRGCANSDLSGFSKRKPITAAGMVPTTSRYASRSSAVSMRPRDGRPDEARARSATTGRGTGSAGRHRCRGGAARGRGRSSALPGRHRG